jgi:tripartite ATP-independent transporter DctM subunit
MKSTETLSAMDVGSAPSALNYVARSLAAALVSAVEFCAVSLIVAQFFLLLVTVVMRYFLHQPLVWADEVSGIGLMWLGMLSAAIAVQRSEHMRLTVLTSRYPRWSSFFETVASMTTLLFLLVVVHPAYEHAIEEAIIQTPALEISQAWKSAAVFVGIALMAVFCVARIVSTSKLKDLLLSALVLGAIAGALWLARAPLAAIGNYNLIVFFLCLVGVSVAAGVPISFSFGIATVAYIGLTQSLPMTIVASRIEEGMSHQMLLSVPLFIVLGLLLEITGMAKAMIHVLSLLLVRVRGGLSYVLIAAIYLISGISGSKAADIAAVAPALFPEMKRRGYDSAEMVSLLAASAAMSETIPPSLVLITLGAVAGVSIGALFTGGLIPALVLATALAGVVWWNARKQPAVSAEHTDWRTLARAFAIALPAIALPFVIRAVVIEGITTTTEVASVGILYCLVVGALIYGGFQPRRLYPMLKDTASLSGAILLVLGAATAMSWALSQSGFSRQLVEWAAAMPGGALGFLVISAVVFILLGALLEGIPALVLFAPLMFPAARAVGLNDVHYSMVVVLAMGIGLFMPPLGVGFFMTCAISGVEAHRAMRTVWKYMAALVVGLLMVICVPWLSTGLIK